VNPLEPKPSCAGTQSGSNEIFQFECDFLNILLVTFHSFSAASWCTSSGKAASAGGKNILVCDCSVLGVCNAGGGVVLGKLAALCGDVKPILRTPAIFVAA
jgi:hypothetical protein